MDHFYATYSARGILFTEDKFPLHFRNPSDYSLSLPLSLSLSLFSLFLIYKWDPGRWKISHPIYLLPLSLFLSLCLSLYLFPSLFFFSHSLPQLYPNLTPLQITSKLLLPSLLIAFILLKPPSPYSALSYSICSKIFWRGTAFTLILASFLLGMARLF